MVLFSAIMLAPALVVRDAMQCAVSYNLSRFVTGSIGVGPFALAARCRNSCLVLSPSFFGLVSSSSASRRCSGAARAADLLDILRGHWGLPATAGGALMRLATTSPEIAVNVTSVVFGWPDLGLGTALGSNVPALPLAFLPPAAVASPPKRSAPGDAGSQTRSEPANTGPAVLRAVQPLAFAKPGGPRQTRGREYQAALSQA